MGLYLGKACQIIDDEYGYGLGMQYGVGEMQGWRRNMEDAHISKIDIFSDIKMLSPGIDPAQHKFTIFAVFDGHGGKEVAKFCKDHFIPELIQTDQFRNANYVQALRETFHRMDEMVDDEANASKLREYRTIPNPSDQHSRKEAAETKIGANASSVDSLLDPDSLEAAPGKKKIQYSRAMELFKDLLKKESDAKKAALGLNNTTPVSQDDLTLQQASSVEIEDNEPALAASAEVMDEVDEDGEIMLDLEVHGACVPVELYSRESAQKGCKLNDHPINAGCTAVVALRVDDTLLVANAGDSRAVLCRMGVAVPLSLDHKPNQIREYERIKRAGGFVNVACRVNGNLNLSRAIGDLKYKKVPGVHRKHQIITADPDITVTNLIPGQDEFLILACDGVWDCFSSQDAVDFVRTRLIANMDLSEIIKEAFMFCLADDPRSSQGIGGDNMTLVVVKLKDVIV